MRQRVEGVLKPRPWWLFWIGAGRWVTVAPHVYHPKDTTDPQRHPSIIAHEKVHLRQQQEAPSLRGWLWRYCTNRAFRLQQEAEAVAVEIATGDPRRADRLRTRYATYLSGFAYLWAARTPRHALTAIRRAEAHLLNARKEP